MPTYIQPSTVNGLLQVRGEGPASAPVRPNPFSRREKNTCLTAKADESTTSQRNILRVPGARSFFTERVAGRYMIQTKLEAGMQGTHTHAHSFGQRTIAPHLHIAVHAKMEKSLPCAQSCCCGIIASSSDRQRRERPQTLWTKAKQEAHTFKPTEKQTFCHLPMADRRHQAGGQEHGIGGEPLQDEPWRRDVRHVTVRFPDKGAKLDNKCKSAVACAAIPLRYLPLLFSPTPSVSQCNNMYLFSYAFQTPLNSRNDGERSVKDSIETGCGRVMESD